VTFKNTKICRIYDFQWLW